MNRIDRLMGVLTTLQSHRFVTAEMLAAKFEISVRTVYRDIRALDEIGIPVSFETGKGYFIVQGYFLPPVSFSSEEANALVLVASLADRFGDRSIVRHSTSALQKIRAILRSSDKERSEQLANSIRVLAPEGHNPASFSYLSEIQKSISGKTILQINYTDARQRKTRREVEPIGIIYYTDRWHLIAWCWLRHDYRDFIVSNIDALVSTATSFRKNDHISLNDHILGWGKNP